MNLVTPGATITPGTAETIAFLVSDRAVYITGHNHFVTGGSGGLYVQKSKFTDNLDRNLFSPENTKPVA